jgi:hypothetical protein
MWPGGSGTSNRFVVQARQAIWAIAELIIGNRFQGSLNVYKFGLRIELKKMSTVDTIDVFDDTRVVFFFSSIFFFVKQTMKKIINIKLKG